MLSFSIIRSCTQTIAVSHFPLSVCNRRSLLEVFKRCNITWHLSGHLHSNYGDAFHVLFRRSFHSR